jgi:hypothetical protein
MYAFLPLMNRLDEIDRLDKLIQVGGKGEALTIFVILLIRGTVIL